MNDLFFTALKTAAVLKSETELLVQCRSVWLAIRGDTDIVPTEILDLIINGNIVIVVNILIIQGEVWYVTTIRDAS